jgi:tRNA-specific 2-thiouridylase
MSRGPILTTDGRTVGEHNGFAAYTIGQRKGLPGGFPIPMYVVGIRPEDRAVVIGPREDLLGRGVIARGMNWLAQPPAVGDVVSVRVRHRAALARGELIRSHAGEVEIALDDAVSAITPGQSIVLYDGERVLGGGFIESAIAARRAPLPILAA